MRSSIFFSYLYLSVFMCGWCVFATGCGSSNNSSDGDIEYVAIGASDAAGIGANPITNGYVFLIEEGLEDDTGEEVELINLGIPGAETADFVDAELEVATRTDPDLITIWAGPNDLISGDSVEEFAGNLRELFSTLRAETSAFIVAGTIPDLTRVPRFVEEPDPDVTSARVAAYNDVIRSLASEFGIQIAELTQITPDATLVSDEDGFHPNNEGYRAMADIYLSVITPAF